MISRSISRQCSSSRQKKAESCWRRRGIWKSGVRAKASSVLPISSARFVASIRSCSASLGNAVSIHSSRLWITISEIPGGMPEAREEKAAAFSEARSRVRKAARKTSGPSLAGPARALRSRSVETGAVPWRRTSQSDPAWRQTPAARRIMLRKSSGVKPASAHREPGVIFSQSRAAASQIRRP